jgi:hypothetical protein
MMRLITTGGRGNSRDNIHPVRCVQIVQAEVLNWALRHGAD